MDNQKTIIIGAGIAGLAAGCYLQMNGYDTLIMEAGALPGGLCTGWTRKGYFFDGCLSWLVGSGPNNTFHKFWSELNVIQNMTFVNDEEFAVVNFKDGTQFTLYADADKLEQEFLRIAPEDAAIIKTLTDAIKIISNVDLRIDKAPELFDLTDFQAFKAKAGEYMEVMKKWGGVTIKDFAQQFKSEFVRTNYRKIFWFNADTAVAYFMATMGWVHAKASGYPVESSLHLSKIIEQRYLELGGKIQYHSRVSRIIVDEGAATGVELDNGRIYPADQVISAADGFSTIFEMLEGKYADDDLRYCYENFSTKTAQIYVGLGISRTFDDMPHYMSLELDKPLNANGDAKTDNIFVKIFNKHPDFAPKGKTSVVVYAKTPMGYWEHLKETNPHHYDEQKKAVADEIIGLLEERLGNIKEHIEVVDVSTPCTITRYTSNRNGSWMGWEKHMDNIVQEKKLKRSLPGLANFYMVGHWTQVGGGLPSVVLQARNLVQVLCTENGQPFSTTIGESSLGVSNRG
ncbi:NAD(P)/FAD-dependent oxidoreductase [Paenibacillus sp. FSL P4-0338]|uniref:phytoene desaturase family protein n=1 Tax=Paenibacillus sp. FSL P4-0338 TaxID=2921635 RepID=UPI0030F9BBF3